MNDDKRKSCRLRRDINDLVRDEQGNLSPTKVGLLIGQWLAIKMILQHSDSLISHWDSLTALFMVLIAPDIFKKMFNMKYSGGGFSERTERTEFTRTKMPSGKVDTPE